MKKLVLPCFTLVLLASCSSSKWDKETVAAKCKKEMKEEAKGVAALTEDKVSGICDCMADKMVAKYKSEAEAEKNKTEAENIAKECAMSALMPAN
jgi:hypothetical protein